MPGRPSALRCDRCAAPIPPGATRYVLSLSLTADFDGVLPEPAAADAPATLAAACDALSAEEAEAQVHLRMVFTVCPRCRNRIVANPLQRSEPGTGPGGAPQ